MIAAPSEGFRRWFGAALGCYSVPTVIRSVRAGRPEYVAVIVVVAGVFWGWASRFPGPASLTFALFALVGVVVTTFVPSSEPAGLHLLLASFGLAGAYLGLRAHWSIR